MAYGEKNTAVIIGAQSYEEGIIRTCIEDLVKVVGGEQNPFAHPQLIAKTSPDLAILYLDANPDAALSACRNISERHRCTVIIVSQNTDSENVKASMEAGARDFAFLDPADPTDIRRAVDEAEKPDSVVPMLTRGKIISFFSAKGGSGATTISSNLAVDLVTRNRSKLEGPRKVVLVDFDLVLGDVAAFLDVTLKFSFHEILNSIDLLDEDALYSLLVEHPTGIHVLAQTEDVESAREVAASEMQQILLYLKQHFDFIVIDGMRDFGERTLVGLDMSDFVVLNVTQEMLAFKNAKRCLRIFKLLGYEEDRIKLVINRYQPSRHIDQDTIAVSLGHRIDGTIRNHYPSVINAINEGTLLVTDHPKSKVTKDIEKMGEIFFGPEPRKCRRWLDFRDKKNKR